MIDRDGRDGLADLLEQMLSGELDHDLIEDHAAEQRFAKSDDRGVVKIYQAFDDCRGEEGIWCEGLPETRAYSQRLLYKVRRAVYFLRLDLEFEWPDFKFEESTDASVVFIGLTVVATFFASISSFGSDAVWIGLFIFGMAANVAYRVKLARTGSKGFDGEVRRQRRKGRELESWPFLHRSDFPPGIEGLIHPSDDPLESS